MKWTTIGNEVNWKIFIKEKISDLFVQNFSQDYSVALGWKVQDKSVLYTYTTNAIAAHKTRSRAFWDLLQHGK